MFIQVVPPSLFCSVFRQLQHQLLRRLWLLFFAFLCLIYAVKVGSLLSLAWTMDGTELAGAGGNGGVVFSQLVIFLFIFDVRAKQMSRQFFFPISQQQAFLLT